MVATPTHELPNSLHERLCALHARYAPRLYACALRKGAAQEAEDLIQEVFLAASRHPEWPVDETHARRLLFVILRRRMVDRARARARAPSEDALLHAHRAASEPATTTDEREAILEAIEAVNARNPRWGEALRLQVLADLGTEEIASILEAPENTVRGWIQKALGFVRDTYAPRRQGHGDTRMDENERSRRELAAVLGIAPSALLRMGDSLDVGASDTRLRQALRRGGVGADGPTTSSPPGRGGGRAPPASGGAALVGGAVTAALLVVALGSLFASVDASSPSGPPDLTGTSWISRETAPAAADPFSPTLAETPASHRGAPGPGDGAEAAAEAAADPNGSRASPRSSLKRDPLGPGPALVEVGEQRESADLPAVDVQDGRPSEGVTAVPTAEVALPALEARPSSILPERAAWTSAVEALTDAREAIERGQGGAARLSFERAAAAYDAYLGHADWITYRREAEIDRAEVALGLGDGEGAVLRLRALLGEPGSPERRADLRGMLVLAEALRGGCDDFRTIPDGLGGSEAPSRVERQLCRNEARLRRAP